MHQPIRLQFMEPQLVNSYVFRCIEKKEKDKPRCYNVQLEEKNLRFFLKFSLTIVFQDFFEIFVSYIIGFGLV